MAGNKAGGNNSVTAHQMKRAQEAFERDAARRPNPELSLGEVLVQPVYFGEETLTLRMARAGSDKYNAGSYHAGWTTLRSSDSNTEIPVQLVRVPKATPKNPTGTVKIRNLKQEDLIANGILEAGAGFTEAFLSTKIGLAKAQQYIANNLRSWYPPEKGYAHKGLDTEVFVFGWAPPYAAAPLQEIKRAFAPIAPALLGGVIKNNEAVYFPEFSDKDFQQLGMGKAAVGFVITPQFSILSRNKLLEVNEKTPTLFDKYKTLQAYSKVRDGKLEYVIIGPAEDIVHAFTEIGQSVGTHTVSAGQARDTEQRIA